MNYRYNMNYIYNKLITEIPKLQSVCTDTFLHNKYRLKHFKKGLNTFEGKYNCGAACSVVYKNLSSLDEYCASKEATTRFIKNVTLHKNTLYDHVIISKNDYIIDPTYRQFLTPNYDKISDDQIDSDIGIDNYHNWLFDKPLILNNTINEIKNIIDEANERHFEQYQFPLNTEFIKKIILGRGIDITYKFKYYIENN